MDESRNRHFGHAILNDDRGIPRIAVGGWRRSVSDDSTPTTSWEADMKTIVSAALILGLCGFAGAQADKADPVGTWKCEYEIGGQQRMCTLTVKKDGDKLAGTMSWPDQKETNVKDLKLKDGTLAFSAVRKFMDNEIPIDYKLTVDGDKLKGKAEAEFGGQKQEFN